MIKIYESESKYLRKLREAEQDGVERDIGDPDDISVNPDVEEAFNELIQRLQGVNYDGLNNALNKICDDPKLYALLSAGFGDGKLADVKWSKSETAIPVRALLPSQREIGLENSFTYPLQSNCSNYFNGVVTIKSSIVTLNKTFIIDGHHRWSQVYAVNPDAKISAINFSYNVKSPMQVLRDAQGAIAVANKDVPSSSASSTNLYSTDENGIRKFIESNIQDVCVKGIQKQIPELKSEEEVVEYFVENAMEIKKNNKPFQDAPSRKEMPQTDPKSIDVMSKGVTDI